MARNTLQWTRGWKQAEPASTLPTMDLPELPADIPQPDTPPVIQDSTVTPVTPAIKHAVYRKQDFVAHTVQHQGEDFVSGPGGMRGAAAAMNDYGSSVGVILGIILALWRGYQKIRDSPPGSMFNRGA